ncbi:MAG: biotin--[acetyl-CoA-carboxylase] ligase [Clostridia bacterium]|nr:biotin--[acetyl-CoA-carboxylase] ligase [Clostridia bacterium]
MKRILIKSTISTNDEARRYLSEGEDVVVCSEEQTGGRGTKGRSFLSQKGGVYLTKLTFHDHLPASMAYRVMMHAAVAVCKTVASFGVPAEIKWPNDVYVRGKKISGTLIENVLAENAVKASIVGIGLNVSNDVSSLMGIATNLHAETNLRPTVDEVRERLIFQLSQPFSEGEYRKFASFLGREISVVEGQEQYRAIAKDVLPDGRLVVEKNGEERALSSAEITV